MRTPALATGLSAVIVASGAWAHTHPCAHTHITGAWTECAAGVPGTVCTSATTGATGTCTDTGAITSLKRCRCLRTTTCGFEEITFYEPDSGGLPGADERLVYTVSADPSSQHLLLLGGQILTEFSSVASPLQGSVTLDFGSFDNPTQVPVVLSEVSLTLVSDVDPSVGPTQVSLGPSGPQSFVYDSLARVIRPAAGELGYELAIVNDLQSAVATAWMEAELDSFGRMRVFQSAQADLPLLEVPTISRWGLLALVLALGSASWCMLRLRAH